ncbi:hypothetical protein CBR_g47073 [Chara braunii]|uniref:Uncharacterized protein n=1 Tax=Chara braunii TaxID=69332 RepID=A0A388M1C7_CHABU|nr:hypothetical protein CBR_g47073 [Chara braunii]|eukprot:GBG88374.1 hypothetical protein CBR_g47073 [Chara braunii]
MEDLWEKMGRYQRKLVDICEEVREWRASILKVFLYESGPESVPGRQGYPGVAIVGSGPRSGMTFRPPTAQGRMAQVAQTRGQSKASANREPPRREPEPERRKEAVEVEEDDEEEEQDERLRQEEDRRADQRVKKRGAQEEAEPILHDAAPKKKKYAVRLEEGFDVEKDLDKVMSLLEEHNLTASGAKSKHCMREATILGFICSEKGRRPDVKKTDKIIEWSVPLHSITDVRSFLDTFGFWRTFIKNFAAKTEHLRKLLRQDQEWIWGEEQDKVVARMKKEFREGGLVLGASDYDATEISSLNPTENGDVLERQDDEFEEGEMKEAFRAEEYDGIYLELGLLLSWETAEERRARVGKRVEEIWEERQRLEATGTLPDQPPDAQMWNEFWGQYGEGLAAPKKAGLGTSRTADEYLDRKIRFLAKASFNRYLMLEDDLAEKKTKEVSHGVHLEAVEAEVREPRALVASQAAIIQDLRRQPRDVAARTERKGPTRVMDWTESGQYGSQGKSAQDLCEQPSVARPSQGPPMGKVILGPEEAKAKREAEREAFEFRAPTELATLPTASVEPMRVTMPMSVEGGQQTASSEPVQGSGEGPMDVLLEAVDTMQEGASASIPEQRVDVLREEIPATMVEEMPEGRPQRLDTPEYVPEMGELRSGLGSWATGSGSGNQAPGTEQQEAITEVVGSPSSPPPPPRRKKFRRKVDQLCFFGKDGVHWALECPKFLKDKASRKVTESEGRMYARQGTVVERSADGGRAQLYT